MEKVQAKRAVVAKWNTAKARAKRPCFPSKAMVDKGEFDQIVKMRVNGKVCA
jgi:hypothetical protein